MNIRRQGVHCRSGKGWIERTSRKGQNGPFEMSRYRTIPVLLLVSFGQPE